VVDWNNLTIACPACNGKKHAKFDETLPFVNPFHDDPDSHFVYSGDLIFAPSSTRGDHSIREIGLNRDAAVRARRRRIEYVNAQVTYWASAATPMKAGIAREIIEDWRTGEYYAAVRGYLRLISFPGA